MVTVSHLVEKEIKEKPFLQEALSRGIVNTAALAEEIRPQIEKEMGKKVKFSALNMAIRRLREKLKKTFIAIAKFDKDSDITVKSNLIEITIYKQEDVQKYIKKMYDVVDLKKGDFLTITQGVHEVMIITNQKYEEKVKKLFEAKMIKKVIKNLSSFTINISPEDINTIGLYYIVTRALSWENISIIDIVSTFTELTFILREKDTARAFETLNGLIKNG